ncbi:MAG: IS1634 family transposase [Thermoplasmata archaeon]
MSFPRITTVRGRHYLQHVESIWDSRKGRSVTRVLAHLGPCDGNGKLLHPPRARVESVHSSFPVGPLAVLYASARELRLRDHIQRIIPGAPSELILSLALNQATARVPIYRLPEWVRASPLPRWENFHAEELTPRRFEEALSALCHLTPEKTWEDRGLLLQQELTRAWRGNSREPAGAYYDITKQAYYGTHCPYGQLGHDERGTAPVVGFGMAVSREHHHPILCRTLPGGQNDSLSVAPTLELLQSQGLRHLTLVMDKGMTSKANVMLAREAGYHVIGSVKGWSKEAVAYASRWPGEELESSEFVVGTSHGGAVYSRAFTAPLLDFPRVRIAVVENLSRKSEDRQARDLLLQELEGPVEKKRLKEIRGELGEVIVSSPGRRGFRIDPKAVEEERTLDGRFLLFSTDLSLDGREMYREYFAKDAVEKAFRTSKGELSLGPVRYRRKDRLDAYATVVYVAYLLWSWAERRLRGKYPNRHLSEAMRSLENLSWVRFGAGNSVREWATRLTTEQEKVLSTVGAVQYVATY